MKDYETFRQCFQSRFWKKLNESLVPFEDKPDKEKLLTELYEAISTKKYQPSKVREHIIINKTKGVVRIVPTFVIEDYCVYFYCIKALDDYLCREEDRVPGTFGAWTLDNGIKPLEEAEIEKNEELLAGHLPYPPDTSYNPKAWREHWQNYQKRAHEFAEISDFGTCIQLDIANFYDCINLDLLEKKVRVATDKADLEDEMGLLFYFLQQWNKTFEGYIEKCVGLPQDELGDCSRVLANFYLRSYDQKMYEICERKGCKYLRYADDQILFAPDEHAAKYLLFEASKEIHKLGLNFNAAKVEVLDKEEFNMYWSFDIFDLLTDEDYENKENIETALELYFQRREAKIWFRFSSVLRRLLYCNLSVVEPSLKHKMLSDLLDKNYLASCTSDLMNKIFRAFPDERTELFAVLDSLINEIFYNSFHYNLRKFYKKVRKDFDFEILDRKIDELRVY